MLLEYGNVRVESDWKVEENIPAGYSRVYYVYSGDVEYTDDRCTTMLKHGHLYIFPSASLYSMHNDTQNRLYCTYFHIDILPSLVFDLIEIPLEKHLTLKYLLLTIFEAIKASDIKLIYSLVDVFESYCEEKNLFISASKELSKTLSYISTHIDGNITIKKLSEEAGYNGQYFIRLFKKTFGAAPHQYIISFRLKEAKKMLKTDAAITEIAQKTGYGDTKAFSRSFKKYFGVSPSYYRKNFTIQP